MLIRLAWKEIFNHHRFFTLFILNLSLGLMGIVAVEGFREGMQETFQSRSKQLLGADLEIGGRRQLDSEKLAAVKQMLGDQTQLRRGWGMYNMMSYGELSRLVHVRVFEQGYPFYGDMTLEENQLGDYQDGDSGVWVYPEIRAQMGVELGDKIQIGSGEFEVLGIILEDPQQGVAGMSLAPRVFISKAGLERAGLIQEGSVIWYSYFFKLPAGSGDVSEEKVLEIDNFIDEPALSVVTPKRSGEQMGRVFDYLSDFLGLVSLVALFLASVGLIYLYRSFLARKRRDMAVYLYLGLKGPEISKLYFWQLTFLGLIGSILGIAFGQVLLNVAAFLVTRYIQLDLDFSTGLGFSIYLKVFAIGLVGVWFLAIPLLAPVSRIRPLILIQDFLEENRSVGQGVRNIFLWLPWFIYYFVLSITVAHSWKVGGTFFLAFVGVPLILFPVLMYLFKKLSLVKSYLRFSPRMAILYISRFRVASSTAFLALALAALLLNIVPMIQKGLVAELLGPENEQRPSLFLFDIQEEQVEEISDFIVSEGKDLIDLSPMVRGRLTKVNGEDFDRQRDREISTREEEREVRFRNRGLNLTFREQLNSAEELYRGELFSGRYDWESDDVGEVSLERRYAQRLGLSIGDIIEVEVLGLPVSAKVTSLRRVRWTSFLPNFFLLFQPGLLDEAPKTYLGAIGPMSEEEKNSFQLQMFERFPSISMLDTTRVVERVMGLMQQMGQALYFMSFLSFLVGGLVLFSLSSHQMEMKKYDVVLLKAQGLSYQRLRWIFRLEFMGIGICAALLGGALGASFSFLVSHLFFDGVWVFDPLIPLMVTFGIGALCFVVSELAMKNVLKAPARKLLEEIAASH